MSPPPPVKPHRLRLTAGLLALGTAALLAWWLLPSEEPAPAMPEVEQPEPKKPRRVYSVRAPLTLSKDEASEVELRQGGPVEQVAALEPWMEEQIEALVQSMAAEHGGLSCRLAQALNGSETSLTAQTTTGPMMSMVGMIIGNRLIVPYFTSDLSLEDHGRLSIDGYQPIEIAWRTGKDGISRCTEEPIHLEPLSSGILGHVRNAEGEPEGRVWVTGCGGSALTDEDGRFYLPAPPGPCKVQGLRQDGYWQSRTEAAEVEVRQDQDVELTLTLPDVPRGGVGMMITSHDEGVLVQGIHEGGSAWEAGLVEGSLVTAVEGEPTAGWDLERFIDEVTGPAGTEVELTIVTPDGAEEVIVLDRREMGPG